MLKTCTRLLVVCAAAFGAQTHAWSQAAYPNRPVRIIVAFPAGQATDLAARAIAQKLTESLGQQFIVDNRPGAASIIGSEAAAKSPNNGYNLFMGSSGSLAVNPGMYSKLPYDPVSDFTPISQALYVPFFIFLNPGVPANNVKELVDYLKTNPNKVNFGSAGTGASNHLSAELFKSVTGVSMVHVPYKGSPPAVTDLLGGQIGLMFETGPLGLPHAKSGKLKVIAVGSRQRSAAMPELVTIAESGYPGFETVGWAGLLSPTGTPKEIIIRLNAEVVRIIAQPGINDRFVSLGAELVSSSPDDFGAYVKSEIAKWGKVIRESGAKAD
jgi:tripartite-type tricarboxylate transporter receptor subunit TctC